MSVRLHRLIRALMGSFPAAFTAPSQNREYPDTFLHSAEVVTCTHKRSKPCCASESRARPHFLCVGLSLVIQANHRSSPRPRRPTLLRLQLWFATLAGLHFGSCRPRHTCLSLTMSYPHRFGYTLWVTPTSALYPRRCRNPS
jgi:hypothetical protein